VHVCVCERMHLDRAFEIMVDGSLRFVAKANACNGLQVKVQISIIFHLT
jgi:hypothetical protein